MAVAAGTSDGSGDGGDEARRITAARFDHQLGKVVLQYASSSAAGNSAAGGGKDVNNGLGKRDSKGTPPNFSRPASRKLE